MIVDAKDLKWYITDTVKNDKLIVIYNYNDKWFDNVSDILENDKTLVDLGDIVVSPDTQIVKVYLRRVGITNNHPSERYQGMQQS